MKQRLLQYLLVALTLAACSGGAPGMGPSGSVGANAVGGDASLAGPGSGGAQPLDAGFSGPSKDVTALTYVSREVRAQVLCEEANGNFQVRLSGKVFNKTTNYPKSGFLRISDSTAQKFLVTTLSHDPEIGNFSTVMTLRSPFEVFFAVPIDNDPVLETLLPFGNGVTPLVAANPEPDLVIEEPDWTPPCMHMQNSFTFRPMGEDEEDSEEGSIPHVERLDF